MAKWPRVNYNLNNHCKKNYQPYSLTCSFILFFCFCFCFVLFCLLPTKSVCPYVMNFPINTRLLVEICCTVSQPSDTHSTISPRFSPDFPHISFFPFASRISICFPDEKAKSFFHTEGFVEKQHKLGEGIP